MDERMDAPNGKRIVELLRKAAMGIYEGAKGKVMDNIAQLIGCYGAMDYRTIDKLADMVEEALQREHETAYDAGYDEGFASADDWCAQHEDAMAEHGWYRALDADKEVIHIGDVMEWPDGSDEPFEVVGIGTDTLYYMYDDSCEWTQASTKHHVKQPTVEDVLREMLDKWGELPSNMTNEAIVAEYAKRLTLAGDAE